MVYSESMKKNKAFLVPVATFAVLASVILGPALSVYADDTQTDSTPNQVQDTTVLTAKTSDTTVAVDPNQDLIDQIAALKVKINDPATSAWDKFWLSFQLRKLEHELALKQTLQ